MRMAAFIDAIHQGEEGHAGSLPGIAIGAVGAILLGIGAAGDTGWLAVVGGIVLAVGLTAMMVLNHMAVDYDIFKRLETLEKK